MIKLAITGNIASGKSQVESFIHQAGYPVYDTDKLAHKILETKTDIIIQAFKDYNISESGVVNRKKLGDIVFNNPDKKKVLENIIHPQLKKELDKIFNENKSEKYVFVSVPLLFEANMQSMFDKIIFVYAKNKTRLERLMQRNNLTKQEAMVRINAQIPQEDKIKKCDYIIENNADLETLKQNVNNILISFDLNNLV